MCKSCGCATKPKKAAGKKAPAKKAAPKKK